MYMTIPSPFWLYRCCVILTSPYTRGGISWSVGASWWLITVWILQLEHWKEKSFIVGSMATNMLLRVLFKEPIHPELEMRVTLRPIVKPLPKTPNPPLNSRKTLAPNCKIPLSHNPVSHCVAMYRVELLWSFQSPLFREFEISIISFCIIQYWPLEYWFWFNLDKSKTLKLWPKCYNTLNKIMICHVPWWTPLNKSFYLYTKYALTNELQSYKRVIKIIKLWTPALLHLNRYRSNLFWSLRMCQN